MQSAMKILGMLTRAAIAFGVVYLFGAFATWELDAGNWGAEVRIGVAWLGGTFAIGAAIIPAIL